MIGGTLLAKCGKLGLVVVQCGCVAHCIFEFVADFVIVSFICFALNKPVASV